MCGRRMCAAADVLATAGCARDRRMCATAANASCASPSVVQSTRIWRTGSAARCEAGLRPAVTLEKKDKGAGPPVRPLAYQG